jgi:hypothetical protein
LGADFDMTKIVNNTISIDSPIVDKNIFDVHTEAIEHYLTELITDIHLAGDSTGDDAIYHAQSLLGTCHTLMGYLFCHSDRLIDAKRHIRQFDDVLPQQD